MRRAGNSAGCGRDREKHNVTEAMVQIRERSRRARQQSAPRERRRHRIPVSLRPTT